MHDNSTITILKTDLLHLVTASERLRESWVEDKIKEDIVSADSSMSARIQFFDLYYQYILSCRGHVTKRDYNALREALAESQLYYYDTLQSMVSQCFDAIPLYPTLISRVFDIGCGLSQWHNILRNVFPNASVWRIDKDESVKPDIVAGLAEFVATTGKKYAGPSAVIFLSEVMHCKDSIHALLPYMNDYTVIVNELQPNMFIDERLKESGGRLYDSDKLCPDAAGWRTIYYSTDFEYYMSIRQYQGSI